MQIFYMITGREALYLYEKNGTNYIRQYIDGNPEFHYQISNAKSDIKKMRKALQEEFNLESDSEIKFAMIENANPVVTEVVTRELGAYLLQKYNLDSLVLDIVKRLNQDKKILVKEFGVNFDGVSYQLVNGELQKADYSLLGYTLQADDIIKFLK